ncbi:MAG: FitA-like ribbon-helix-helix domain-containing protein [Egibacteraceae bacterium]
MAILHIKNVPDDLHAELRRRAQLDGVTIRDYVLGLIRRDQALPPRQEWLARVRRLPPVRLDRPVSEHLAEEREVRGRELATRLSDPAAPDARSA